MSTVKVDNIHKTGESVSRDVSGVAVAWCNWDASTAIRGSLNIASIVDQSTGVTTISYINNLANSSYANGGAAKESVAGGEAYMRLSSTITASQTRWVCETESGTDIDGHTQTVSTLGDLA